VRGLQGSAALVTLGALSAALYASSGPLAARLSLEPLVLHVGVAGLLFATYLAGLWLVMRRVVSTPQTLAVILGFAALFRLLVLPTPVYLSSDLYRYLWDGRVQLAGVNPYRYPPEAPGLAPLRDAEVHPRINRPGAVTVYPPGAQWVFALAAMATPGTVLGWRLLLLAVEVGTVGLLLQLVRRMGAPPTAILAYAWSPLVVLEGIQAGHVDLLVIPIVLLALAWRLEGSSLRAGVALGAAALLKLYPLILVLAWWRRGEWRFPAAVAATVALGYLPYVATLGLGALGFLPTYVSDSYEDFNIGLRAVLTWGIGLGGEVPRAVAMMVLAALLSGVLVWIARHRPDGPAAHWRATQLAIGAYLLLIPTAMHPWYVLWVVPFLCVAPPAGWVYFSGAVALSYVAYLVEPAPLPWWAWLGQYGPLYAFLLVSGYRTLAGPLPGVFALRATGAS
jgi:alpha-1,6-mannosyltransferase